MRSTPAHALILLCSPLIKLESTLNRNRNEWLLNYAFLLIVNCYYCSNKLNEAWIPQISFFSSFVIGTRLNMNMFDYERAINTPSPRAVWPSLGILGKGEKAGSVATWIQESISLRSQEAGKGSSMPKGLPGDVSPPWPGAAAGSWLQR